MVGVAQSVERWIVAPEVVGSIPIVHPSNLILYSCERGGIGRRARFRIWYRKMWEFESPRSQI